ncbi:MAG: TSUP family transporter [Actinomycetota bacterium]
MDAEPRRVRGWAPSVAVTVVWAAVVIAGGLGSRVIGHWESAVTMLGGSFLAGSSPEGGGAVAFPVFTKALQVPAPVARSFGLSIQAVGMSMATVAILLARRPFHRRAVVVGTGAAVPAFLLALVVAGRPDALWWPSAVPGAWVKATFSIVLATTSVLMVRHLRHGADDHRPLVWNRRFDLVVIIAGAMGGVLASMTGTGANITLFLALVVVADVAPKRALPSAIMVMAAVSVVGLVVLGLVDGQLDVTVAADQVIAVGGRPVALDASRTDLFGLWLAAVPVVAWGAPLGSLAASVVDERLLVRFIALLAAVEVVSTFVLVPELRTEPALIAYLAVGLVAVPVALIVLRRHRHRVFGARFAPSDDGGPAGVAAAADGPAAGGDVSPGARPG